jgi:hypothetical protein
MYIFLASKKIRRYLCDWMNKGRSLLSYSSSYNNIGGFDWYVEESSKAGAALLPLLSSYLFVGG